MPKYFAAPGSPFSDEDAEQIGPELQALSESGASGTAQIVEFAQQHPDCALRRYLDIDRPVDEVAEKWYQYRARKVAGSIMIRVHTAAGYTAVRAFHSVDVVVSRPDIGAPRTERRYMTVAQVRRDADAAQQVVERARRELDSWRQRYADYEDVFGPIFAAIDAAA